MHLLKHIYDKNERRLQKLKSKEEKLKRMMSSNRKEGGQLSLFGDVEPLEVEQLELDFDTTLIDIEQKIDDLAFIKNPFLPSKEEKEVALKAVYEFCGANDEMQASLNQYVFGNKKPLYTISVVSKGRDDARNRQYHKKLKNDSVRYLAKPCEPLKRIQRLILHRLEQLSSVESDTAYGFVKGKSHFDNALFHAQSNPKVVLSMDIENFFGTTTQVQLRSSLHRMLVQNKEERNNSWILTDGILLLCTFDIDDLLEHEYWYKRTHLIRLAQYFNCVFRDPYFYKSDFYYRYYLKIEFENSQHIIFKSRYYHNLFQKLYPNTVFSQSKIEDVLTWIHSDQKSTDNEFCKDENVRTLAELFFNNEPYSWRLFDFVKEVAILGAVHQLGHWKGERIRKDALFEFAFSVLQISWSSEVVQRYFRHDIVLNIASKLFHEIDLLLHKENPPKYLINALQITASNSSHISNMDYLGTEKKIWMWYQKVKKTENWDDRCEVLLEIRKDLSIYWDSIHSKITKSFLNISSIEKRYIRCLPQGAPTSPILSNIAFRDIDNKLLSLATQYQLQYSRYADDLTFSGKELSNLRIGDVARILEENYYRINRDKTSVRKYFQHQEVNGLVINDGHVRIGRKYYQWIRAEIQYVNLSLKNNILDAKPEWLIAQERRLKGHLNYVSSVDPKRHMRLVEQLKKPLI